MQEIQFTDIGALVPCQKYHTCNIVILIVFYNKRNFYITTIFKELLYMTVCYMLPDSYKAHFSTTNEVTSAWNIVAVYCSNSQSWWTDGVIAET